MNLLVLAISELAFFDNIFLSYFIFSVDITCFCGYSQIDVRKEYPIINKTKVTLYDVSEHNNETQPGIWKFNGVEQLLVKESGRSAGGMTILSDQQLCVQATFYYKGSFRVMPLSDQDTHFVIPSYSLHPSTAHSEFAVFAGTDNTKIRILTPHNNKTITERLNKGEVYMTKGTVDLTGSSVMSNKPVAVFSSVYGWVPTDTCCACSMTTQVPSVSSLGMTHIIPPIANRGPYTGFIVRVIPATNHTQIQFWSSLSLYEQHALNAGEFWEFNIKSSSEVLVVHCSIPCLVVQYNKGLFIDDTSSQFMLVIPPTNLYRNRFRWTTKVAPRIEEYINNYANIIIKEGNFLIQI